MDWTLLSFFSFLFFGSKIIQSTNGQGCTDSAAHCSSWKSSGFCDRSHKYYNYMSQKCPFTCNLCPPTANCVDKISYCRSYRQYCNHPDYIDYVKTECKLTCNYCHITTAPPPTTQPTQPYTGSGGRALQPGCGHKGPGHDDRIVGGTNSEPGDWPWQVNIDYEHNTGNPGHWCGGTLINEEWVLSAAHCFHDDNAKEKYWLKLGEHNIKRKNHYEQQFNISQLIIHPNFNPNNYDYDLALLRLHRNATLNDRVRTACLPDHKIVFTPGTECYISGWGLLSDYGVGPAILQQAKVPIVSDQLCKQAYGKINHSIKPRMLCAGFSNGTIDSCQGDSGGPLVCKQKDAGGKDVWYLWGSISWGVGCARNGVYGVYSKIISMRKWIDSIVYI